MNKYLALGAVVAGLGLVYLTYRGAKALPEALETINPLNNDNVINKGVESLYQSITGSKGTIGGDFYDGTHGGALDVTSGNNFINQGVEGVGSWLSGSATWTLGGQIYDWTH